MDLYIFSRDILNNRIFKHIIQEYTHNGPNLYYSQFFTNPLESEKLIMKSYIAPPRKLIATILEEMLFFIILNEFHLETGHLFKQEDIRHLNYTNIISTLQMDNKYKDNFRDSLKNDTYRHNIFFMN
ncbi:cilia- and flagella-associated protein 65-like [Vespula squamosa]|uniref:Cilia- and flagella-associated protein 65-like n=1 Tax=Vespula squamosa TaxID=30214 RepID=A0ABD2AJL0_VESSQ